MYKIPKDSHVFEAEHFSVVNTDTVRQCLIPEVDIAAIKTRTNHWDIYILHCGFTAVGCCSCPVALHLVLYGKSLEVIMFPVAWHVLNKVLRLFSGFRRRPFNAAAQWSQIPLFAMPPFIAIQRLLKRKYSYISCCSIQVHEKFQRFYRCFQGLPVQCPSSPTYHYEIQCGNCEIKPEIVLSRVLRYGR